LKPMSIRDFTEALRGKSELEITVRGRRTKKTHSAPVWFTNQENKLYLLPVKGSDTNWYRNVLKDPRVSLTVDRKSIQVKANPITKPEAVREVIALFADKYGGMREIKRWYSKLDVAVEISLV